MTTKELQEHPWKVYFNHGEGQTVVFGMSEKEARAAAVSHVRNNRTLVDFRTADELVKHISPIS